VRPDLDPAHIAHEAYGRGVVVTTLDAYYVAAPDRRGLLLGYGSLDEADVTRGARLLADVIAREARDTRPHGSLVSRAEAP